MRKTIFFIVTFYDTQSPPKNQLHLIKGLISVMLPGGFPESVNFDYPQNRWGCLPPERLSLAEMQTSISRLLKRSCRPN
jgi:hypothetical protein